MKATQVKANHIKVNDSLDKFQVAILMDTIQDAKFISDALREFGIFAHYYEDLDDMWVSLNAYTPGFCIVDVKKMSQGNLQLKQHPKIKSKSLRLSFFYKESTKALLSSTKGLGHYGLICADLDIEEQIRIILERRHEELRLVDELDTLKKRVTRLKTRGNHLSDQQEAQHYKLEQLDVLNDLIKKIGRVETQNEFYERILHVFSNWDSCLEFGMYYLNSSRQKLVSPKSIQNGYKQLPDLWLNESNEQGIEGYAQEMASDVCLSEIEGDLVNIRVEGLYKGPDILIWGKFDKKNTKYFQWDLLEEKLNSEYRKVILLENQSQRNQVQNISMHNLLFELDDIQFHHVDGKYRYVLLDFSRLLGMIRQRPKLRFNWKQFYNDLSSEIALLLKGSEFRFSTLTPGHFIISISKKSLEKDFSLLSSFTKNIELWRYFNDSATLINFDITPDLKMISPSSINIIRQLEDGNLDIMQDNTSFIRPSLSVTPTA